MNDAKQVEKRLKRLAGISRAKLIWIAESAGIKLPPIETSSEDELRRAIAFSNKYFKAHRK